jgi:hypothetical protein
MQDPKESSSHLLWALRLRNSPHILRGVITKLALSVEQEELSHEILQILLVVSSLQEDPSILKAFLHTPKATMALKSSDYKAAYEILSTENPASRAAYLESIIEAALRTHQLHIRFDDWTWLLNQMVDAGYTQADQIKRLFLRAISNQDEDVFLGVLQSRAMSLFNEGDLGMAYRLIPDKWSGQGREMLKKMVYFLMDAENRPTDSLQWDLILSDLVRSRSLFTAVDVIRNPNVKSLITTQGYEAAINRMVYEWDNSDSGSQVFLLQLTQDSWDQVSKNLASISWEPILQTILDKSDGVFGLLQIMRASHFWSSVTDAEFTNGVIRLILVRIHSGDSIKSTVGSNLYQLVDTVMTPHIIGQVDSRNWLMLNHLLEIHGLSHALGRLNLERQYHAQFGPIAGDISISPQGNGDQILPPPQALRTRPVHPARHPFTGRVVPSLPRVVPKSNSIKGPVLRGLGGLRII